jgi:hypothetical protein
MIGDTVVATAILDRLLHDSQVPTVRGGRDRLREKRPSGPRLSAPAPIQCVGHHDRHAPQPRRRHGPIDVIRATIVAADVIAIPARLSPMLKKSTTCAPPSRVRKEICREPGSAIDLDEEYQPRRRLLIGVSQANVVLLGLPRWADPDRIHRPSTEGGHSPQPLGRLETPNANTPEPAICPPLQMPESETSSRAIGSSFTERPPKALRSRIILWSSSFESFRTNTPGTAG